MPSHHVLIASANIGGNNLQDDSVFALPISQGELRKINIVDFNCTWTDVCHAAIACHALFPLILFLCCKERLTAA